MQLLQGGSVAFPVGVVVHRKDAGIRARFLDGAADQGARGNVDAVAQCKVAQNDGTTANGAVMPMVALPATPTQPAMAVLRPTRTL